MEKRIEELTVKKIEANKRIEEAQKEIKRLQAQMRNDRKKVQVLDEQIQALGAGQMSLF